MKTLASRNQCFLVYWGWSDKAVTALTQRDEKIDSCPLYSTRQSRCTHPLVNVAAETPILCCFSKNETCRKHPGLVAETNWYNKWSENAIYLFTASSYASSQRQLFSLLKVSKIINSLMWEGATKKSNPVKYRVMIKMVLQCHIFHNKTDKSNYLSCIL